MKRVRIGDLRHRVTILVETATSDGAGGHSRTHQTGETVFAAIEARARRETVEGGRQIGLVSHNVVMRWRSDISGGTRLKFGDVLYRVLATEALDPARRYLRCLCEEEQS